MISRKRLSDKHHAQINALWNEEYPTTLVGRFPMLLEDTLLFKHFIILNEEENVMAWAAYFQKDEEIRFSILVGRSHQGKGYGKQLINAMKNELPEFYAWVIDSNAFLKNDGTPYVSPLPFYTKLGFEVLPNIRIDNHIINAVKIRYRRNFPSTAKS